GASLPGGAFYPHRPAHALNQRLGDVEAEASADNAGSFRRGNPVKLLKEVRTLFLGHAKPSIDHCHLYVGRTSFGNALSGNSNRALWRIFDSITDQVNQYLHGAVGVSPDFWQVFTF